MNNNSRFFFVLLSLGAAIGLGNIWLYPYLSYKFGGLFVLQYLAAMIIFGLPLLLLEFSIGQYFNKNIVDLFASVKKWLSPIGWLMLFNSFILMCIYAVILSWHIIYIFVSFGMQWKADAKAYFLNNVLQASSGINNFHQFSLPVFIALIIAWLLIFLYIRNGFESMKKWFLATLSAGAFAMILFLVYSLSLENALNGVYAFLRPNLRSFMSIGAWIAAFSLAAMSLGLSFGIMPAVAGKSDKGFVSGASYILLLFEALISIAVGFMLFSILGFLGAKQNIGIENLVFSDFGSEFTLLAQALPFFYKPAISSLVFFILLAIFFVIGACSLAYAASNVLVDKFNTKKVNAAIVVSGFGFLFGLLFVIKPGFYIMDIIAHFLYYNILIALLLEAVAIGWFFESERLVEYLNHYSAIRLGAVWNFIVKYIAPLILMLLIAFRLKSDIEGYKAYPWWAVGVFGFGIVIVPLVLAFLMPQKILDRR